MFFGNPALASAQALVKLFKNLAPAQLSFLFSAYHEHTYNYAPKKRLLLRPVILRRLGPQPQDNFNPAKNSHYSL
jgi:hypothetical protein